MLGADDLAPRYLSSNESKLAAAEVALEAAAVALFAAPVSLEAAAVALEAAAVADVAAAVLEPTIPSTYVLVVKSAFALGVYVAVILLLPAATAPVRVPPAKGKNVSVVYFLVAAS